MKPWLEGKKTYLIGAALILISGLKAEGFISTELYQVLCGLLTGGGLMALRAGVKKVEL